MNFDLVHLKEKKKKKEMFDNCKKFKLLSEKITVKFQRF